MSEDGASMDSKNAEGYVDTTLNQGDSAKNTPKNGRKDIPKESKLASLAKNFRADKGQKKGDDLITRFTEGVFFKAKIIGVEDVPDARGDTMCQVSLQRLKAVAKNSGEHKLKVTICVSIEGLKIRAEKTADLLYHHPVHRISFISQDAVDTRAFGYIYGSPDIGHKFYALKTDKTASFLVISMRDLFQVVYDMKKQEIEMAKEHRKTLEEQELIAQLPESSDSSPESIEAPPISTTKDDENCDNLLDLESELNNLRHGISQMDTSISAAELKRSEEELDKLFENPFGDSFLPPPLSKSQSAAKGSSPISKALQPPPSFKKGPLKSSSEDLSKAFDQTDNPFNDTTPFLSFEPKAETSADVLDSSKMANSANIFDSNILSPQKSVDDTLEQEEEPVEPEGPTDLLADLDPLGKRPFVPKRQFFKELRPQKVALKDMNSQQNSQVSMTLSRNPFDVDSASFEDVLSVSSPPLPPRLPTGSSPPTNPSSLSLSKSPGNWINFETSPPEAPPPLPPCDIIPPTPPPRPASSITHSGSTPPLPKRDRPLMHSPKPFILAHPDPRSSSDAGYDSCDDQLETVGTSPSSTSSPPTSPPIPIPSRRPPVPQFRQSTFVQNHSSSVASHSSFVLPPPPQTSHSLPSSKSLTEAGTGQTQRRKISMSISISSHSNNSTPEPMRRPSESSIDVDSESPNPSVPEEKETELSCSADKYAVFESLERGQDGDNFNSIFDSCLKKNAEEMGSLEDSKVEATLQVHPILENPLLIAPKIDDPFEVKLDNFNCVNQAPNFTISKSNSSFEATFPDVFSPEPEVKLAEVAQTANENFANFEDGNSGSKTPTPNTDFVASFPDNAAETNRFQPFKALAEFGSESPKPENVAIETDRFEPFKAFVESPTPENVSFATFDSPEMAELKPQPSSKIKMSFSDFFCPEEKPTKPNSEDVLSPVSYLNSKDIFCRQSDPFDDDFFQG